jgi:hypothetical protein
MGTHTDPPLDKWKTPFHGHTGSRNDSSLLLWGYSASRYNAWWMHRATATASILNASLEEAAHSFHTTLADADAVCQC